MFCPPFLTGSINGSRLPVIPNPLAFGGHLLRTQNLGAAQVAGDSTDCTILVHCHKTAGRALESTKSKLLPTGGAAIPKSLLTDTSPTCFLSSSEGTPWAP